MRPSEIVAQARDPRTLCTAGLVMLMLALSGCTSYVMKWVVLDKVPESPVFTVIPASSGSQDMTAANAVTEALVSCGARVIERPVMLKEQSQYEGQAQGGAVGISGRGVAVISGSAAKQGEASTSVDPISLIKETSADYVLIAQGPPGSPWVRLVKREDGLIVFAGQLTTTTDMNGYVTANVREDIRSMLTGAGLIPHTSLAH